MLAATDGGIGLEGIHNMKAVNVLGYQRKHSHGCFGVCPSRALLETLTHGHKFCLKKVLKFINFG